MKENSRKITLDVFNAILSIVAGIIISEFFIVNFMSVDDNEVFDEKGVDVYNWAYHSILKFTEDVAFSFIVLFLLFFIKYVLFVNFFKVKTANEIRRSFILLMKFSVIIASVVSILFYIMKPWM